LNLKPRIKVESELFVGYLEDQQHVLGSIQDGIAPAIRKMVRACGEDRLAQLNRKGLGMSYSMRLPEEEPRCECFYDEARDEMDREDCPFHCDLIDEPEPAEVGQPLKQPGIVGTGSKKEDAA
jgi:hypothetical protein